MQNLKIKRDEINPTCPSKLKAGLSVTKPPHLQPSLFIYFIYLAVPSIFKLFDFLSKRFVFCALIFGILN